MKYNLIITHIGNAKAKSILARHLAHDPSISLQKALSLLENLPIVYMTGILQDDAQLQLRQLEKIECKAKLEPIKTQVSPQKSIKPFVPEYTPAPHIPHDTPQVQKVFPQFTQPKHPVTFSTTTPKKIFFTKKKFAIGSIVSVCLTISLLVVIGLNKDHFNWTHASTLDWSKTGMVSQTESMKKAAKKKFLTKKSSYDSKEKIQNNDSASAKIPVQETNDNAEPTPEQMAQAQTFCDSAKKAVSVSQAISFYKLAIAFNNKNIAAWYSLREAYSQAMMTSDIAETEESMKRIFGETIFSLSRSIEQFGTAKNMSLTKNGVYRVEYIPNEPYKKNYLLNSFLLMKAMRSSCGCHAISLNLVSNGSTELLVYTRTENFPATFDEFKASAKITYLK